MITNYPNSSRIIKKDAFWTGSVAQVIECLPSSQYSKKKKKKKIKSAFF
jgi:hypothetical protein